MSATPHHSGTLSRIAQALAQVLGADAQSTTADLCGCSQSAVSRRADDLHQWPASDLLRLALRRPELARAICRELGEARPDAVPMTTAAALVQEVRAHGHVVNAVTAALADGRIEQREAAEVRDAMLALRRHEDEVTLPRLAEIVRGGAA